MSRYIKKFRSTTALGPTEERGFALWAGYEIEGNADLSYAGLVNVEDWSEERLREIGVTTFTPVDAAMRVKLGVLKH